MRHSITLVLPALVLALSCGQGEQSDFQGGTEKSGQGYKTLNEPASADATKKKPTPGQDDAPTGLEDDVPEDEHDHEDHEQNAPAEEPAQPDEPVEAPAPAPPPAAAPSAPAPAPLPAPGPAPAPKDPNVVEFRIKAGTGAKAWNTEAEMVVAKVGQTVRIVNDDTVVHRLHTGGAPCPHGTEFAPGATFECKATRAFDPKAAAGPVYDHIAGRAAAFWLKVNP